MLYQNLKIVLLSSYSESWGDKLKQEMDHFYYQGHCCQLLTGQLTCQAVSESQSSDFIAFHFFFLEESHIRVSEPVFHPASWEIPRMNPFHKLQSRWWESHWSYCVEILSTSARDMHTNRWGFACVSLSDVDDILNSERSFGKNPRIPLASRKRKFCCSKDNNQIHLLENQQKSCEQTTTLPTCIFVFLCNAHTYIYPYTYVDMQSSYRPKGDQYCLRAFGQQKRDPLL